MYSFKHSVKILETETEFLLFIHASQKDRAKAILGYRWDMDRLCWVYPKTARAYDALIDEFGDDLVGGLTISRPGKPTEVQTDTLQSENQDLKEEIAKIHKTLELLSKAASDNEDTKTQDLKIALAEHESELFELRYRNQDLERKLEEKKLQIRDYFAEVQRLRATNQRLQSEIEVNSKGSKSNIQNWIKVTVKNATGQKARFCEIVDRMRFREDLPLKLVQELENELRRVLNCDDQNANIYDLIVQASDAGVLTERGTSFAHAIRKQRNIIAHEPTDNQTIQVRLLFCLFAAALLWAELPE